MQFKETIRNAGGELKSSARSINHDAYGFLFRDLRSHPWRAPGSRDPRHQRDAIFDLSQTLYGTSAAPGKIPAGYTFFGQFVTHDLTFAVSPFERGRDGRRINQRTPRFDLDCVYGRGPEVDPHLYELRNPNLLLIGRNEAGEPDLPRNADTSLLQGTTDTFTRRRTALIGDPRNDENVIVSQLHLAIALLHNRLVSEHDLEFAEARKLTRWSYQHAVIDFLRRVCDEHIVDEVLAHGGKYFRITPSRVFMPVEFSFAAFRMGHSMLGDSYHLNDELESRRNHQKFLLFADAPTDWAERNKRADNTLEGQRELPEKWTIQWDRFVGTSSQPSQLIDDKLSEPLRHLPIDVSSGSTDERERSLAYRTLLRGWLQDLPSGQKVAEFMGEKVLTPVSGEEEPLWLYMLREALNDQHGERLGPVGSRIVTEVCVGLLDADRSSDPNEGSFYAKQPSWTPWSDVAVTGSGAFGLEDLLRAAGVPMHKRDWDAWIAEHAR